MPHDGTDLSRLKNQISRLYDRVARYNRMDQLTVRSRRGRWMLMEAFVQECWERIGYLINVPKWRRAVKHLRRSLAVIQDEVRTKLRLYRETFVMHDPRIITSAGQAGTLAALMAAPAGAGVRLC